MVAKEKVFSSMGRVKELNKVLNTIVMKELKQTIQLYKGYTALLLCILGFAIHLIYLSLPIDSGVGGIFENFSTTFFLTSQLAALALGIYAWSSSPGKWASISSLFIIIGTLALSF